MIRFMPLSFAFRAKRDSHSNSVDPGGHYRAAKNYQKVSPIHPLQVAKWADAHTNRGTVSEPFDKTQDGPGRWGARRGPKSARFHVVDLSHQTVRG